EVRAKVWRRSAATIGTATVVLDIDGSLHQIHSENKVDAAANYKGGYGSTRSTASPTPPVRPSPCVYAPATPGPVDVAAIP
ncbi:MAG: hypothetical protein ABR540_06350, partial [Acidimicrobiales bacterium]